MSKTTQIFQDHFYRLDSNRVKQYEETHVVDDVKVLEQPKKGAKTVLVHSPYLMANVLVHRKDLKKHDSDFWHDKYRPQINHIDDNASWSDDEGGRMYETYGEELEYVRQQAQENPKKYGLYWKLMESNMFVRVIILSTGSDILLPKLNLTTKMKNIWSIKLKHFLKQFV